MRISLSREVKLAIFLTIVALISLGVCGQYAFAPEAKEALPPTAILAQLTQAPESAPGLEPAANAPDTAPPPEASEENPYAGWQSWCEPIDNEVQCKDEGDCAKLAHPVGHPLRCVHPWWAKKDADLKICAPGYARKSERVWRHRRLREIVRQQYFNETDHCVDDDRPIHEQHWRCQKEWRQAETLTTFLWIPYKRETTARPWKRHRLNPDKLANEKAWVKQAPRYGWKVEIACANGKKRCPKRLRFVGKSYPISEDANPHYGEMWRWQFGLGGLGQNSALWTAGWDKLAPPEILCREVEQFETYLRRARRVVKDLNNGIDCDGDVKKDYWNKEPTWVDVHRGASGGKVCPKNSATQKKYEDLFRGRAKRAGLDPDQKVTTAMLGEPIAKDGQNARAAEIYAVLKEKLPLP